MCDINVWVIILSANDIYKGKHFKVWVTQKTIFYTLENIFSMSAALMFS